MFGWIFGGSGRPLWIEAFALDTTIKLSAPIKTPLGRRVSVISPCVDVQYLVRDREVEVKSVRLSRGREFGGTGGLVNVSAPRAGEVWHAARLPIPSDALAHCVEQELKQPNSSLRRMMLGRWLEKNGALITKPFIDAINSKKNAAEIEELLKQAGRSWRVSWIYDHPETGKQRRTVLVRRASGTSISATDLSDHKQKTFLIERISDVRFVRET